MPAVLARSDFYTSASVLHPLAVGGAILVIVFVYIRLASPRSFAQMTIFSILMNITLGSTMSRIITQPGLNLTRGVLSIVTIIGFMHVTDELAVRFSPFEKLFRKEPRLLFFRGQEVDGALKRNRLTIGAMRQVLRGSGSTSFDQVECIILEMNGSMSIIKALNDPINDPTPVLDDVPRYSELRAAWAAREKANGNGRSNSETTR